MGYLILADVLLGILLEGVVGILLEGLVSFEPRYELNSALLTQAAMYPRKYHSVILSADVM